MLLSVPVFALVYAIIRATTEARLRAKNLPVESSAYEGAPESLRAITIKQRDETDEVSDI
jgi:hypothetical protein